jgi:predicted type IV restriction endonuclease
LALKTKQIDIQLIDSKENPADALTKALPKVDFERLRKLLVSKTEHQKQKSIWFA